MLLACPLTREACGDTPERDKLEQQDKYVDEGVKEDEVDEEEDVMG